MKFAIRFLALVIACAQLTACTKFCSKKDRPADAPEDLMDPRRGGPGADEEQKPVKTPNYAGITVNSTVKLGGQGGTGKAVASDGKSVSVKYTEWVYDPAALGNMGPMIFSTNADARLIKIGKGEVIRGFEEGLKGLKKGAKRKLIIPANEAYGADGQPPRIPPNAMIMIDLEVVDLN